MGEPAEPAPTAGTSRRIAVVNRGDAATRALHALHDLRLERDTPITTVALFVEGEEDAPFVRAADERHCLGPASRRDPETGARRHAYLDLDLLREALVATRADTAWVGWGFVSESADFAQLCADLGVRFVGPPVAALRTLGDKASAKTLASALGLPVVPWSGRTVSGVDDARDLADRVGYPLLVKAAAGGGGRGIRRVDHPSELDAALVSASAEAESAFGDGSVLLELLVRSPRHLEVQVVADDHGTVWTLGVRDCTVQRRRQKVVEEAGVGVVDAGLARALERAAADLMGVVGYSGLGTVEFLLDQTSGEFFFMEVNPRLQVEHTVTEAVAGVDLVTLQLELADGARLSPQPPALHGYAVEARITAEDPTASFRPAPGRLVRLHLPAGPGIRVDTGYEQGSQVLSDFDPLVLKVVASGRDRRQAVARLRRALAQTDVVIADGASTLGFVQEVLAHRAHRSRQLDTTWLDVEMATIARTGEDAAAVAVTTAAVELAKAQLRVRQQHLMSTAVQGRPELLGVGPQVVELAWEGKPHTATVGWRGPGEYAVELDGRVVELGVTQADDVDRVVSVGGRRHELTVLVDGSSVQVDAGGWTHRIAADRAGTMRAPTPGVVVAVRVSPGERVEAGQIVLVLESMKLEVAVRAEVAATVRDVLAVLHTQVDAGAALVLTEPEATADDAVGAGSPIVLDPIAVSRRRRLPPLPEVRRVLQGYDPVAGWRETCVAALAGSADAPGPDVELDLDAEVEMLRLFADVAAITRRTRRATSLETPRASGAQAMLHAFMRRPDSSPESLPPEFLALLRRCLARFGVPDLASGPALADGLFRLTRAAASLDDVAVVLVHVVRRWLSLGSAAEVALAVGDLADLVVDGADGRFPGVAHAVRAVLHESERQTSDDGLRWADGDERIVVDADLAARTELWRLRCFDLTVLAAGPDLVLVDAVAREHPDDRRLVAWAEVADPGDQGETEVGAAVEAQLTRAFALLQSGLVSRFGSSASVSNRVVVYVHPVWDPSDAELSALAGRLATTGQGLALDKILLRIRRPRDGADRPVDRLLHLAEPADGAARFGETPPAAGAMRPLSPAAYRLLRLRRRGLHDPYDVVDLLVSPHARVSPFDHGRFQEHDLDAAGRLVPVTRPPHGNTAGVVVGLISNETAEHPAGMLRVIVLSDPTKELGALAEPECRRILGALDLAERLGVPLEWFAVSAGARVSMEVGTESMDWVARVLRRIVTLTAAGHEINVVVAGVTVGAQPYFQAEATMLMHTRGILVMVQGSSMVLTGKDALDFAGGVSAEDNPGIGGFERVMGGNGEAQYWARDLEMACDILFRHYAHTYVAPGELGPRARSTPDPVGRDVSPAPHRFGADFATVGEIFDDTLNPGRRKPFRMRSVMDAVVDAECRPLERWAAVTGGEGVVVWDAHLGGQPVCLIGVESHTQARWGAVAADGPPGWSGATLFPRSSKKVARAINAASGNRPVVVLASLAGFDGSPESMRELQLEYGAEIARAVTTFQGPIVFCIVSRNHGGAFVVFSKQLNDRIQALAVRGAEASVIGGSAAAAVVFAREVEQQALVDPRVVEARASWECDAESGRVVSGPLLERALVDARNEARTRLAHEYDRVHTVERALAVGSVDRIIRPEDLRPELIAAVQRGLGRTPTTSSTPRGSAP